MKVTACTRRRIIIFYFFIFHKYTRITERLFIYKQVKKRLCKTDDLYTTSSFCYLIRFARDAYKITLRTVVDEKLKFKIIIFARCKSNEKKKKN